MKTDGSPISLTDFNNLEKGIPYCYGAAHSLRVFSHFTDEPPGRARAVNTEHKINEREYMRWLTENEFRDWMLNNKFTKSKLVHDHMTDRKDLVKEFIKNVGKPSENVATTDTMVVMKKENVKMASLVQGSRVNQALAVVKSDGTDALWRVAAKQSVKLVRAPLVAFLTRQALPAGVVGFLTDLLDTDNGEAVLAYVMGSSMCYLPQFGTDPKFVRLAKECRVLGAEVFLSKVADIMLNPFREQIADLLKAVPLDSVSVPAERAG